MMGSRYLHQQDPKNHYHHMHCLLMKGCKLSCLEIMMKYYKADAKALRRIVTKMEKAMNDGIKSSNESEEARVHHFLFE